MDEPAPEETSDELAADALVPAAPVEWPACPECGRRRLAVCPVCETSGTEFEVGFFPQSEQDAEDGDGRVPPLVVLCPICDEAFRPTYLARCEWCGHPFPDGRRLPLPPRVQPSEINGRVIAVVVGMVATVVGLLLFFAAIARQ